MMTRRSITQQIKAEALRLGFSACGVARADIVDKDHQDYFLSWLERGNNADMAYMANYLDQRMDPRIMHPGTESIISLALNYYPQNPLPTDTYQIAYYAYGQDYHDVLRSKLRTLADFINTLPVSNSSDDELDKQDRQHTDFSPRICVDTAPILERYWAWKAGLGWIGKNHSLIIPGQGSFFLLGEILTNLDLIPDTPMESQCGNCHHCIDNCHCLAAPVFNAADCWSYQTIENKHEICEIKWAVDSSSAYNSSECRLSIYGCDRCQLVCHHNRHADPTNVAEFQPSSNLVQMKKSDWHNITIEQFRNLFRGSAVKRVKFEKLRNTIDYVKRIITILLFLVTLHQTTRAQNALSWEQFIEDIYSLDDDVTDINGLSNDELIEELQYIHDHPINLNATTMDELKSLPFLSETQIKDILEYISKNSPMLSLGELMLIYSLDAPTRQKMMLFCYAGEQQKVDSNRVTIKKILKYSQNELTLRTDIPFYTKAGYKDYNDSILLKSPNKQYVGDCMYRSLRYSFSSLNHINAGINIEKDAGEKEFDYLSAYIYLRQLGSVKVLALGDYKISFGQGLVINNSMGFGKTMMLSGLSNMDKGITKHSSLSESNHLRGAATTVMLNRNVLLSAFASYTNNDGTLMNDSSDVFTSWKTDGLHRTPNDRNKKGIVGNATFGGNIRWETFSGKVRLGMTGVFSHLSKELRPKCDTQSTLYKSYNAKGTDFAAYSLSYSYYGHKIMFRGETALNQDGAPATMNFLQLAPNSFNRFIVIQRFYSYRYSTLYGHSIGENSSPQNESGLLVGWNGSLLPKVKIDTYFDWFYFPYRKYQVSDASQGWEAQVQTTYNPTTTASIELRYRIKSKQKDFATEKESLQSSTSDSDDDEANKVLAFYTNQCLRLQYYQELSSRISLKSTIYGVYNYKPSDEADTGFLISEAFRWTGKHKEKIDFAFSYFNTDNYNSRVYAYEPGLLYSYGMTSYFYHGIRALLSFSMNLTNGLTLQGKLATTKYFNRDIIGTAQETIEASHKEDLQIQLRWKF